MDDSFVPASPARVAAYFADPAVWRSWWPGLDLRVDEDRADQGIRWRVAGPLIGRAEVWIEAYGTKGSIVHFFLRGDPPRPRRWLAAGRARRMTNAYRTSWKRRIHALADQLASRPYPAGPGSPHT
jgi:hypothetical protein